ncbi:MAG: hypothetical protein EU531_07705 [Promethearchaeota archaeon]|nr:MAG: hypothetical protein EU531_07705 [Candidatus Lokiarchaeota archaeon]
MTLSNKLIESFKNKPDQSKWNYILALQQLQNAIFELEKDEDDPIVLKDLSTRALDIGKDLEELLNLMETDLGE